MSIFNKEDPADRPARPNTDEQQHQRKDATNRADARNSSHAEAHRYASENNQYESDGMSMPPPPRPSSAWRGAGPPRYASPSEASRYASSSQLPGIRSYASDSHNADGQYSGERRELYTRSGEPSSFTASHHADRSYYDSASYGRDEPAQTLESRQPASTAPRSEAARLQELRTGPSAPPPMLTGLPQHSSDRRQYRLVIRQQPQQGRLCGLGSKDKRPLDPLPILQLRVLNEDGTEDEDAENSPNLVLQVSLRKEDPTTHTHSESVLVESNDPAYPWTRMLEGRLVASANVARDLDGSRACFFVFTDLSIRQEGQFRLAFKLIAIGPPALPQPGAPPSSGGQVLAEALTEPFAIYSPRRFPGMTESTELAKCLARQGIQVPVRNDIRRRQEQPDAQPASGDERDELD